MTQDEEGRAPATIALLPCGNCDAPARWVEIAWRVKCTRPSCGVVGGKFEAQREAFAAWNTRHRTEAQAKLREAAAEVLAHRLGDLPARGWLKDNDGSRLALANLAAALRDTQP